MMYYYVVTAEDEYEYGSCSSFHDRYIFHEFEKKEEAQEYLNELEVKWREKKRKNKFARQDQTVMYVFEAEDDECMTFDEEAVSATIKKFEEERKLANAKRNRTAKANKIKREAKALNLRREQYERLRKEFEGEET